MYILTGTLAAALVVGISYGQSAQAQGSPLGPYGQPPQAQGAPPGSYGQPSPAQGAPPGSYGQPSQARGTPPGSYLDSCTDVRMEGGSLVATCRQANSRERRTTLSDARSCVGGIANINGKLRCNRAGGGPQPGYGASGPGPGGGTPPAGYGAPGPGPSYGR
jgi:hypothetical protein